MDGRERFCAWTAACAHSTTYRHTSPPFAVQVVSLTRTFSAAASSATRR